jgi:hypothetical protein
LHAFDALACWRRHGEVWDRGRKGKEEVVQRAEGLSEGRIKSLGKFSAFSLDCGALFGSRPAVAAGTR